MHNPSRCLRYFLLIAGTTFLWSWHPTFAQQPSQNSVTPDQTAEQDEEEKRRLFRTFRRQRQSGNGATTSVKQQSRVTTTKASNGSKNNSTSKPKDSTTPEASDSNVNSFIGFTIWEMRPSTEGVERRSFKLKKSNGQTVVLRPFRLGTDKTLTEGESYIFSIESARTGYLYVIDREIYEGGVLREPVLLFPTKGVRGGNYQVSAGETVEIPDQKQEMAYFEATKNGRNHIGEALTIIVSPEPLLDPAKLRDEPIALDVSQVNNWEKQWGAKVRWAENLEAKDKPYTEMEGKAGGDSKVKLSEDDPIPQRVYRIDAKPGSPLIVTVKLLYAAAKGN